MQIHRQRLLELALEKLQEQKAKIDTEKQRIDSEVSAIKDELRRTGSTAQANTPKRTRRTLSAKARKALSERMKKYWSERRKAEKGKGQT